MADWRIGQYGYFAGESIVCVNRWYTSAAYFHLRLGRFSRPVLYLDLCLGESQGSLSCFSSTFSFLFFPYNHNHGFLMVKYFCDGIIYQMSSWKAWEEETETAEYQVSHGMTTMLY